MKIWKNEIRKKLNFPGRRKVWSETFERGNWETWGSGKYRENEPSLNNPHTHTHTRNLYKLNNNNNNNNPHIHWQKKFSRNKTITTTTRATTYWSLMRTMIKQQSHQQKYRENKPSLNNPHTQRNTRNLYKQNNNNNNNNPHIHWQKKSLETKR